MSKNDSKILDFFSKYKNQPFEFVIVTDINIQEHPNYYKAIFRNIETNLFHSTPMTPEMMRYKYKVGHVYTNGKHVGQNKTLLKGEFFVNINTSIQLMELSDIIYNESNFLSDNDLKESFMRQYAHVEEQDDCTLVIPCYTIANRFYFISSSMKHAIMSSTLGELYYEGSFRNKTEDDQTVVKLHIKRKAGKKDLPFLCRFIGSSFARNRLEYVGNQKSLSNDEYQPIKAQFPSRNAFNIYASYIYIGNDRRGKPKYLVLNIHSDNAPFGFDKVYYKQYSENVDPQDLDPEEYIPPKKSKKRFKRKKPKRDNKVYTGTPSSDYAKHKLYTHTEEYYNNKVAVFGETLYKEGEAEPLNKHIPGKIGNSFEKPAADGDKKLGETEQTNDDKEANKEKNIFNLENFYQFYEALLTFAYVEGSELVGPNDISLIKNNKKKGNKSKSKKDGDDSKNRRFLFGELSYDQKAVYIVEIEQDDSWGPSTWIFYTDESIEPYTAHNMKSIIEHYIEKDFNYKELTKYVSDNYKLSFERKDHKNGDLDDDSIERWCESVLKKLI
ncbi:hypothetical protein FJR48_08665 [Sulfurimonas lithotrophica]|uniref:TnsE C-terminal domain-containing protein n=1 Tax=Sulfurimonas lithotrophica TaxID=2590022 RepID=A0A5P8P267_9BACT|nr:hypothetical protein [Sulfurimonas lithotrophica]QFR49799.1 hypothetical protein FJR48_08665 [Sulfurimonas lithotrophica]